MLYGPKTIHYDKYGKPIADMNQIYAVGKANQEMIQNLQYLLPAPRHKRPLTSYKDFQKYHLKRRDVLQQKWYDEKQEPVEGWPENYEYAQVKKVGEEPRKDNRLGCIKKWRRPLSAEKEYSKKHQKHIDMQKGQSLKQLFGADEVNLLRKRKAEIIKERNQFEPQQNQERQHFLAHFERTDYNQHFQMKQAALQTFHKKFLYWLERDKKQIEEKIQNEKKLKEFQDHKHIQKLKKIETRRQFVGEEIKNVKNYGKIFSDKVKFKPVNIKRIKQKYPQVKEIKTDGTLIDFYPKEPEDIIYWNQ